MSDNYKGLLRVGSWIPVTIVHGIIIYCYLIYMGTLVYPIVLGTYKYEANQIESIFSQIISLDDKITNLLAVESSLAIKRKGFMIFIILHSLVFLVYYSLIKTMSTLPGSVPKSWKDEIQKEIDQYLVQEKQMITKWEDDKLIHKQTNKTPLIVHMPHSDIKPSLTPDHGTTVNLLKDDTSEVNFDDQVDVERGELEFDDDFKLQLNIKAKIELLDKPGRRFCKRCLIMKPPRTHHCRQCQTCWLKMDHHCQFVNNCIGFGNYKYFLNLITYSTVLLIFMLSTYARTFVSITDDSEAGDLLLVTVILFYLFLWVLCMALVLFLLFHLRLLLINQTTLEFMEKKKDALQGNYDHGIIENIQAVLGFNCLYWLMPIFPNYEGSGTKF